MAFDYRADPVHRQIHVTATDPIELRDALDVLERQAREGAWGHGALVDMRAATWVPTPEDIHRVVETIRTVSTNHGTRGPVAFVTSENMALFGMIRMYSKLADARRLDVTIDAFLTLEEAAEWLGYMIDSPRT